MSYELTLRVHIQPGASQNEIVSYENGILRIRINAPPVEGKANARLVEFLSDILDTAKSNIVIEKGLKGKDKVLKISGITGEQLKGKIT